MPSKIKKAIGVVKDHTSIGLAKVSSINSSNLEVAILKATTHDEIPIDERYVKEVVVLTSSTKFHATVCAQSIAKRIGRTRNWIVALKSLILVLRLFQDGDPHFAREVLHAMKRGSKIVNLSNFRDDSNSSPWDYTAFIRTFALYLDERLNCFLKGKLQRRVSLKEDTKHNGRRYNEPVRDMKPGMLLDRIFHWQRLLDRAIATQPTGAARANRLVQISIYSIVQESFDLYRDISDGLALLLDSFFHLQYQSCVDAFHACVKASKQFEELCKFYSLCKSIGVGRISEYPSVRTISEELIGTLQEFLKDQSSFPANARAQQSGSGSHHHQQRQLLLHAPDHHYYQGEAAETSSNNHNKNNGNNRRENASEQSETTSEQQDRLSGSSEQLEQRTSLEDLMSSTITDHAGSAMSNFVKAPQLSLVDDLIDVSSPGMSRSVSEQNLEQLKMEQSPLHDLISANFAGDHVSCSSLMIHHRNNTTSSALDLGIFDDQTQYQYEDAHQQASSSSVSGSDGERQGWEIVLVESASDAPAAAAAAQSVAFASSSSPSEPSFLDSLYNQASSMYQSHANYFNPFLSGESDEVDENTAASTPAINVTSPIVASSSSSCASSGFDSVSASHLSPLQANPTFNAQNPNELTTATGAQFGSDDDPFAPCSLIIGTQVSEGSMNQHQLHEQQLMWLQHQSKIMAKHVV